MREIKFRVWDKEKQEMVLWEDYAESIAMCIAYPDENSIVMQYTGLKDKNGKEIYEGDIVSLGEYNYECVWISDDIRIPPCWDFIRTSKFDIHYINFNRIAEFEIIGNIYENPELLERQVNYE